MSCPIGSSLLDVYWIQKNSINEKINFEKSSLKSFPLMGNPVSVIVF